MITAAALNTIPSNSTGRPTTATPANGTASSFASASSAASSNRL
jgi:hypothetical protein